MTEYSYNRVTFKHFYKKAVFNGYLRVLRRHIKQQNVSIVDFGASNGNFLLAASNKHWVSDVAGFEIDAQLIEEAPPSLRSVINEEDLSKPIDEKKYHGRFDVAVSFHVIEHVPDGDLFVRNISNFMKRGGLLMLATPNLSGLGARFEKQGWMGFKHDHINLYTYDEFRDVLAKHGFIEVQLGSTLFKGLKICKWRIFSLFLNDIPLFFRPIWPWSKGEAIVGVWRKC
jgi:SAM-dependent methyltransferase